MSIFLVIHIDFVSYWMKNQRKLNVCALEGEKICNVQGFDKIQESPLARKDLTPQVRFTVQQVLQCLQNSLLGVKTTQVCSTALHGNGNNSGEQRFTF